MAIATLAMLVAHRWATICAAKPLTAYASISGMSIGAAYLPATERLVSVPWRLIAVDGRLAKILVEDEGCNYALAYTRVAQAQRQ